MPARRPIDERVAALERRLGDSTPGPDPTATEPPANAERVEQLEARIETLEADLATLQSELQAVRGYVGNVEHVNETVEQRANAAIAAVERLEAAPKTPPPIATATPKQRPDTDPAEDLETKDPSAAESADPGLIERLRDLG